MIAAALSAGASELGRWLLAPVPYMPGWLSASIVSALSGIFLLAAFKHTSNQRSIRRVRDNISANLLALKLFKESAVVALSSQGRVILGATKLFVLALVPMAAMAIPVTLILGQLALWYQARPLRVGESALVTVTLNGESRSEWPIVSLDSNESVSVVAGPVRVKSRREVVWEIKPLVRGTHSLLFRVADQFVAKEVAAGDGFMRVSLERPGRDWSSILRNPWEAPFPASAPIRSIAIAYPQRKSWTSGTDSWLVYWFAGSMVAGFLFRRALGVAI